MGDHISRRATIGLIFAAGLVNARRSIAAPIEQDVPAQIPGAIRFDLGGRDGRLPWRITLYVPPGDAPAAGWPVLYLLDGNAVTATAIDIERVQASYPEATGLRLGLSSSESATPRRMRTMWSAAVGTTRRPQVAPIHRISPVRLLSGQGVPPNFYVSSPAR